MAYVTMDDIEGMIPAAHITRGLDDDKDGEADTGAWDALETAVEDEINGLIAPACGPYSGTPPAVIRHAARVLACEALYLRGGVLPDNNPWTAAAKGVRDLLARIGRGEVSLGAAQGDSADAITEPAKCYSRKGDLMA